MNKKSRSANIWGLWLLSNLKANLVVVSKMIIERLFIIILLECRIIILLRFVQKILYIKQTCSLRYRYNDEKRHFESFRIYNLLLWLISLLFSISTANLVLFSNRFIYKKLHFFLILWICVIFLIIWASLNW